MSTIFFIADLHFGHKDVIAFDHRPFRDVDEMEEEIIRRWNARVSKDDHVFVIGDMRRHVRRGYNGARRRDRALAEWQDPLDPRQP